MKLKAKLLANALLLAIVLLSSGINPAGMWGQGVPILTHAVASGEVTDRSAVLWARADGPAQLVFLLFTELGAPSTNDVRLLTRVTVDEGTDFIAKVVAQELEPDTVYSYLAWAERDGARSAVAFGRLRTAPLPYVAGAVTLLWSADLGGQTLCRNPEYTIFRAMAATSAQLFLMLGDSIYADNTCPSPPNEPGSEMNAAVEGTLDAYRAKHRYNRADLLYLELLAQMPVYATWDDHEVEDDFAGPVHPLMPLGRQAFLEYYPILPPQHDPSRLYRSSRWGRHLEVFILDTRQYRSSDDELDGPAKTMLGAGQLTWLKEELRRSDATWKVLISSVSLSIPLGCPRTCDDWSNGGSKTGFERELLEIADFILQENVLNVAWLTGDTHFPQVIMYDPDRDGEIEFFEFTAGPLSASRGRHTVFSLDRSLYPSRLYVGYGFFNFGVLSIDEDGILSVEIRDEEGQQRFQQSFQPIPLPPEKNPPPVPPP